MVNTESNSIVGCTMGGGCDKLRICWLESWVLEQQASDALKVRAAVWQAGQQTVTISVS